MGISNEARLEVEGKGVRKFEQELYYLLMGWKKYGRCSLNVRRAYDIYERDGKLEEKKRYLSKKYKLVYEGSKLRGVENLNGIMPAGVSAGDDVVDGEETCKFYVLRSRTKYRIKGKARRLYKKYGGRDSTDLVLFAWKFMSKEAIGPHVNVDWQAVEFEMREIVR